MTILDAVALDLRNIGAVLDGDRHIQDELQTAMRLGSIVNKELVMLRAQIARFANETSERAWTNMGWTE